MENEQPIDEKTAMMLRELAEACLGKGEGWRWGPCHPEGGFASIEEAIADVAETLRNGERNMPGPHARQLWCMHTATAEGSLLICHTGNGPTSEAHARFFAVAPGALLALLREREHMRALLAARVVRVLEHTTDDGNG